MVSSLTGWSAKALTYKGSLKFAVCAKQVNGEGKVQHEWHSRIGTGTVYDGIEASAEDIGGFDLRAYIQQTAAEVRQAVQDAAASAKNAETQASDANKAAKSAADNATAAKKSADDAAAAAKTADDAATKVIEEGVAEKLTEMQNIQKDVSTKAQTAETAAKMRAPPKLRRKTRRMLPRRARATQPTANRRPRPLRSGLPLPAIRRRNWLVA